MSRREPEAGPVPPSTCFAPAERASAAVLSEQVALVARSPLVGTILGVDRRAMVVLNAERQIVALNDGYLLLIGCEDPHDVLGLRPGEAVHCVHAWDHPGGCGTSRTCSTCGAVIAIMVSQQERRQADRECSLRIQSGAGVLDLQFLVQAVPVDVDGQAFTTLLLQDVTAEKRRVALERTFFHDVNNLLAVLLSASNELEEVRSEDWPAVVSDVTTVCRLLAQEVAVQRALTDGNPSRIEPRWRLVPVAHLVETLRALSTHHPAAKGKAFQVSDPPPERTVETDPGLVGRVMSNIVINAFEATPAGGVVRLVVESQEGGLQLRVWNPGEIPPGVVGRIFQRHFSTKEGVARGHGTYAMKLLGEGPLQGRIEFTTSPEAGTIFTFWLPWRPLAPEVL